MPALAPAPDVSRNISKAHQAPISVHQNRAEFWSRIVGFDVLLAGVLAAFVYFFATRTIADPDIWWHLRNAEHLLRTGEMVRQDFYSFTAAGAPWVNHEWLGELPFYFAWRWCGFRGLYLVVLLLAEAIILGVFYLSRAVSENIKAAFLASWIAAWLATVSFGPRTLLFGWLFLVFELAILTKFSAGVDRTWLLPPLFLIWANTHGSWLIGMVLLLIYFVCGLVQWHWGRIEAQRWTRRERKKLRWIFALSLAALFVNPCGYRLVLYPFNLAFHQTVNIAHISEWQSLDFHSLRGKFMFVMLAATIVLGLARRTRWRLWEVVFIIIAFYSAMTYSRFMFLAAIVVTPFLARELNVLSPYRAKADRPIVNAVLLLCLAALSIAIFPTGAQLEEGTRRSYPGKALPYLERLHPEGRVFNDYLWGGYLIWNARQIPVFVDSRVDIFEYAGVFQDYLTAKSGVGSLDVLAKYHIRYVLHSKKNEPLAYLLMHTSGWKVDYEDDVAVLLERIGPVQ